LSCDDIFLFGLKMYHKRSK